MLASAEHAAELAAEDRPGVLQPSNLMVAATKAMNQAGGFLEAVSILAPELGPELLDEFEAFASRVESLSHAIQAKGERRVAGTRRSHDDRRAADRRLSTDRRRQSIAIAVERRHTTDRRGEMDRRTGRIRELADRRWRAIQR